jgi:uncharacterized membrane protein YgaE (UPF0421/DUF939 family)
MLTLLRKFSPWVTRFALSADIITIPLLSFFLQLQFRRWQKQDLVKDGRIALRRIGKKYYELNIQLTLESYQAEKVLSDLFVEMREIFTHELHRTR